MYISDEENITLRSTLVNDKKVISGFCTKNIHKYHAGLNHISNVYKKQPVDLLQTHSDNVLLIDDSFSTHYDGYDAIISRSAAPMLTVRTADCVPILYADSQNKVVGISHQGWRGTLKQLPAKVVRMMISLGAKPDKIKVAIGPAIGGCCYQIYGSRLDQFKQIFPQYVHKIVHSSQGKQFLNLGYLNYLVLREAGLQAEQIDQFPFCTKCDTERFFSYQRGDKDPEQRMLSYITIHK